MTEMNKTQPRWGVLVAVWALHCATAHAATDCNKAQLADGEQMSSYLADYASSCLDASLKTQLTAYMLPDNIATPDLQGLTRMRAAWMDIAATFGQLSSDAGPEMKKTYASLQSRAQATLDEIPPALTLGTIPDISPLRHNAWGLGTELILNEAPISTGAPLPVVDVRKALDADCPSRESALCAKTLEQGRELMRQWKLADRMTADVSHGTLFAIKNAVVAKDALWNTYLYDSKPMLPLDFWLTDLATGGWSKSDQFLGGFRAPPKTQWFLLHPTLGVEYMSHAEDGEQMKPILFVEVIGANRWNPKERWFKAPVLRHFSGASLVATYADRAGVKDSGYGFLLTFSNVYSIGAARYGDDTGVFLSIDLSNLIREKYRPKYEKFKNELDDVKGKL